MASVEKKMQCRTKDASASRALGLWLAGLLAVLVTSPLSAEVTIPGWRSDFESALETARKEQKPVLATVSAVWCGACRQMQQLTLNDVQVSRLVETRFIGVVIDGDQRADLVSRYGVTAFPTTFVLDAEGKVLKQWVGFQSSSGFHAELMTASGIKPGDLDEFPAVSALFPTNASPFEFGGFCLVSLLDDNKLRRGVDNYFAEHRGTRICFYSAEHRNRFLSNPDRYWPVGNGKCLVTSREDHHEQPGDPRVGVLWKNRLWFFADRDRQRKFIQSPDRFSNGSL